MTVSNAIDDLTNESLGLQLSVVFSYSAPPAILPLAAGGIVYYSRTRRKGRWLNERREVVVRDIGYAGRLGETSYAPAFR